MDTEIYFYLQLVIKMLFTSLYIMKVIRRVARLRIDYLGLFACILLALSFSLNAIITPLFVCILEIFLLYRISNLIEYVCYNVFKLKSGEFGLANVAPTIAKIMGIVPPECWLEAML